MEIAQREMSIVGTRACSDPRSWVPFVSALFLNESDEEHEQKRIFHMTAVSRAAATETAGIPPDSGRGSAGVVETRFVNLPDPLALESGATLAPAAWQ